MSLKNMRIFVYIFCLIKICLSLSDEANKIKSLNIKKSMTISVAPETLSPIYRMVSEKFPYSSFSHEVTKIQTTKLSLLLSFYFHVMLEHLKILRIIRTNFRFKRVLCFAIQDA